MKQNEKRIYSGWESLNTNDTSFGVSLDLRINPIPPILTTLLVGAILYGCYLLGGLSALYLQKFTDFLLIPKVLNLPILQNPLLYQSVGYLTFAYIGLAFFLDWVRFINRTCFTRVSLKGDLLSVETRSFFGKDVFQWNRKQSGVQIVHKTGVLRRLLGLERIWIVTPDLRSESVASQSGILSPYFFRGQNRNLISSLFQY
ncbi:hypothetical protein JWG45_03230 [Leptospira sp. 201903070]|uniref:PH domain-containing protein n=1 Tax=Leptospira ainlahdjerensis TaxID=2810033 RepID=A0ABS2U759_9LEPT|nr:hypothetical protein [Leptospira ainlahdjerensis]MBM9576157.1 hypothetical protein [Leptospira ainlahdjerensis]